MNKATFLFGLRTLITGQGFKKVQPIGLREFCLASDGATLTTTLTTNPGFDMKGTSSKSIVLSWAASKVIATGLALQVPDDYDETNDHLKLRLKVMSAGAADTPTFSATAYVNGAATDLAPDATAAISATLGWVEFDLSDNSISAGDVLTIAITPAAHTTDAIDVFAAKLEYRSDLVFNDDSDGR